MSDIAIPDDPKRQRIGLIIPSSNRMVEEELVPAFPREIGVHLTRMRLRGIPPSQLLPAVGQAAGLLADAGCAVVAFHCTATSMEDGAEVARNLLCMIRQAAPGLVALSTASALLDALAAFSLRKLALLTPYSESVTLRQRAFLEEAGIEVQAHRARDLNRFRDYSFLPAIFWEQALLDFMPSDAPAVLLSCANLPFLHRLASVERTLGRPVLASNQVLLWAALRHAGVEGSLPGLGRLGALPLPVPALAGGAA